jgi:Fe-S oxidoreductase
MTMERCTHCGMCKANCPIFKAMLEESVSPRGKSILIKKDISDEIFYMCSLCKACENECPSGVKLCDEIRGKRKELVEAGKELESNRKMIRNIREHGNPFGKVEKGKKPKELYCC